MTQDMIRALSDKELLQVREWGEQEQRDRTARRKQETIATIRRLASEAGVSISIEGIKGRPKRVSGVIDPASKHPSPAKLIKSGK